MRASHTARGARALSRRHGGFTLLELLVAIGIIGILATLLLSVVMGARHHARDTACRSNLAQLWTAVSYYANDHKDHLFTNFDTPLRISNVIYKNQRRTGWGCLYSYHRDEYGIYYCPEDPVRGPDWDAYGWQHWETEEGEVQSSYGWRGGQNLVDHEDTALTLAALDSHPQKVIGCDYYEDFTPTARIHHDDHINVLRCNGSVQAVGLTPSFGPDPQDFQDALDALDR